MYKRQLDNGEPLPKETATVIANAMKIWAVEMCIRDRRMRNSGHI